MRGDGDRISLASHLEGAGDVLEAGGHLRLRPCVLPVQRHREGPLLSDPVGEGARGFPGGVAQQRLQAVVLALVSGDVFLEEFLIRLDLNVDEIRDRQRVAALAEVAHLVHSHQFFPLSEKAGRSSLLVASKAGGRVPAGRKRHSMPLGWGSLCRCEPFIFLAKSKKRAALRNT